MVEAEALKSNMRDSQVSCTSSLLLQFRSSVNMKLNLGLGYEDFRALQLC